MVNVEVRNSFYAPEGFNSDLYEQSPRQSADQPRQPPHQLNQYVVDSSADTEREDDFYASHAYKQASSHVAVPRPQPPRRAPSPPPGPSDLLFDRSHLQPGNQVSHLPTDQALDLYRKNADGAPQNSQFNFAVFLVDYSKNYPIPAPTPGNVLEIEKAVEKRERLLDEALARLKKLAERGHTHSQYFLADCYTNGIGTYKNRRDLDRALPLFVLAAKRSHPDAAYRAGTCFENGWGCARDSAQALQFFKKAAVLNHPGALHRLGVAELNGELGLSKSPREGVNRLKRAADTATAEFPHALHELSLLHEEGIPDVVFVDTEYAVELLAQAAELGYAPSAYRLGEFYEYGKLGCPQDAALSIHYYNIAAQQNHRDACFALTAWYLVGSPGVLPQSDTEAFLWARRAADAQLTKAMYTVGYFLEVGIGTSPDQQKAIAYFKKAAELGDKRAQQRLKGPPEDKQPSEGQGEKNGKDCVVM